MGLFLKKQKVFISHKRIDGSASAEAVFLKSLLDKNLFLDTFMDIHEDTLGEFPLKLREKIYQSNSFIFLIPFDGNVSFLNNPDGWVYKEIDQATYKYMIASGESQKKAFQILPITFSNRFEWPSDLPKSISIISQFDICKLNLNDKPAVIKNKLKRALHNQARRSINWLGVTIFTIMITISALFGIKQIAKEREDSINTKRVALIKDTFASINASKIQPSFIIPIDERSPLEDSIYHFFVLRDQFYNIVEKLPMLDLGIVKDDTFTAKKIKWARDAHGKALQPCAELTYYVAGIVKFANHINDKSLDKRYSSLINRLNVDDYDAINKQVIVVGNQAESLNPLTEEATAIRDKLGYEIDYYLYEGKIKKALKKAILYCDNYKCWELLDEERVYFEETAKLCNYLLGQKK